MDKVSEGEEGKFLRVLWDIKTVTLCVSDTKNHLKVRYTVEPSFLNLICSRKLLENRFVQKQNLLCLPHERCMTDQTGISMKGLSGRELRPEVC